MDPRRKYIVKKGVHSLETPGDSEPVNRVSTDGDQGSRLPSPEPTIYLPIGNFLVPYKSDLFVSEFSPVNSRGVYVRLKYPCFYLYI